MPANSSGWLELWLAQVFALETDVDGIEISQLTSDGFPDIVVWFSSQRGF